ncbi:MAG: hypothetical protein LBC27_01795 [Spirochaetaceae bacterium]|jgi:hypothetical protein|nr:hypothetical protein [Spirochaetaceae bacterium]
MTKKIGLCLFITALFLISCVTTKQEDPAFKVTYKNSLYSYSNPLTFDSHEYLMKKEEAKAAREMREPDYSLIPQVGYILFRTVGLTLESAKASNWLFIIIDNTGKEVYRSLGKSDSTPNYNVSQYGTSWYDYEAIRLDDTSIEFPLQVHIVEPYSDRVYDITISNKQQTEGQ